MGADVMCQREMATFESNSPYPCSRVTAKNCRADELAAGDRRGRRRKPRSSDAKGCPRTDAAEYARSARSRRRSELPARDRVPRRMQRSSRSTISSEDAFESHAALRLLRSREVREGPNADACVRELMDADAKADEEVPTTRNASRASVRARSPKRVLTHPSSKSVDVACDRDLGIVKASSRASRRSHGAVGSKTG